MVNGVVEVIGKSIMVALNKEILWGQTTPRIKYTHVLFMIAELQCLVSLWVNGKLNSQDWNSEHDTGLILSSLSVPPHMSYL